MRETLTKQEVEILLCFADMDMKVKPTAEAMHYDRRTIWVTLEKIFRDTGFNPREFWDLHEIMKQLEKEDGGEQQNEVHPEQDATNGG